MSWLKTPDGIFFLVALGAMFLVLIGACYTTLRNYVNQERLPYALRNAELETLVSRREAELIDMEQRLATVNDRIREGEAKLSERDRWEAEAESWRSQVESLKAEYAGMESLRKEIEEVQEHYRREIEQLADTEQKVREAKGDWEGIRVRVAEAERHLSQIADEENRLHEKQATVQKELAEMEARRAEYDSKLKLVREEAEVAQDRIDRLLREVKSLESRPKELDNLIMHKENVLNRLNTDLNDLEPKRKELEQIRQEINQELPAARDLEQSLAKLQEKEALLNARIAKKQVELNPKETDPFTDLSTRPNCLKDTRYSTPMDNEAEDNALERVRRHLAASKLQFHERVINAFHTSLKIGAISPLTVLAGVSGTGKSQLPKLYAEAMGMHFLKLAVQPRWDGPQDLLGFYNYIEQRYKATEFAQALVHMDVENWSDIAEPYRDHMLLVLLDEMNLARVEYYFSEFLSRLEGRPGYGMDQTPENCLSASIMLEILGQENQGLVYVGHNILFVGTMNDDESTLALSNKVLDRSNVLYFSKPPKLRSDLSMTDREHVAHGYLSHSCWAERWTRKTEYVKTSTTQDSLGLALEIVERLNEIMEVMGHPFGHRMSQAILHYVDNYPKAYENQAVAKMAVADQIELRILPRLRGINLEDNVRHLKQLKQLVQDKLDDEVLANAIEQAGRTNTGGYFAWRGLVREQ